MKRKAKVRRSRDLPAPDINETPDALASSPATPGRLSIESIDEHKTGSIESVPRSGLEDGVAGFIEPCGSDAEGARLPHLPP